MDHISIGPVRGMENANKNIDITFNIMNILVFILMI